MIIILIKEIKAILLLIRKIEVIYDAMESTLKRYS